MPEEIKKEESLSGEDFKIEDENVAEKPKRKSDFYIELALFLILGILIGLAVKTEAAKTITIGFEDYKMKIMKQDYPINQIQKDLAQKSAASAAQQDNGQVTDNSGAAPSENSPSVDSSQPASFGQDNQAAGQDSSQNSNQ